MSSLISPISGAATYASHARSNANFLKQYTDFADRFYAPPSDPTPAANDQPARPLTRALPNLKSAGVFSYLRGTTKSGNSGGGQSRSAAFRAPAPAAAEVPIMPPMAHAGEPPKAIHDDAGRDNPIQTDGVHRTRIPGSDDAVSEKKLAQLASMPAAQNSGGDISRAIRERNRAILTIFKGPSDMYRSFSGQYAS